MPRMNRQIRRILSAAVSVAFLSSTTSVLMAQDSVGTIRSQVFRLRISGCQHEPRERVQTGFLAKREGASSPRCTGLWMRERSRLIV